MKCEECKELLCFYAKEELSAEEMQQVKSHLETCEACQMELAEMLEITGALSSLPEVELPETFHSDLMAKLEQEAKVIPLPVKNKKVQHRWKQLSLVAAAVLAVVVLGQAQDEFDFTRSQQEILQQTTTEEITPSTVNAEDAILAEDSITSVDGILVATQNSNGAVLNSEVPKSATEEEKIANQETAVNEKPLDEQLTTIPAANPPDAIQFSVGTPKVRTVMLNPQVVTLQVSDVAVVRGEIIDLLSKIDGSEVMIENENLEITLPSDVLDSFLADVETLGKMTKEDSVGIDGDTVQVIIRFEKV